MKKTALLLTTFLTMTINSYPVYADDVDDAYRLCAVFTNTGMSSECDVKAWGHSVDVRMDTTAREGIKICQGVVEQVSETMRFNNKWTLRIFLRIAEITLWQRAN